MTTQEDAKFLGLPKSQIPIAALMVGLAAVLISMQALVFSSVMGLRSDMNTLRVEMNANDNTLRSDFREDIRAVDARVDALTVVVVEMNARVGNMDTRLANTEMKVDRIETRVGSIDARLANTEMKVDRIETRVESIERQIPDYNAIEARFSAIERDQTRLYQRLDALSSE